MANQNAAAATTTPTTRMRVGNYDEASQILLTLGTLEVGPQGRLGLVDAKSAYRAMLARVVDEVNARKTLILKVPPPAGNTLAGGVFHRTVERDAPDLLERLGDYFEQRYDLMLLA